MNIAEKIKKYTHKLRNANSREKADYYQKKLMQYHTLNQKGGIKKYIKS